MLGINYVFILHKYEVCLENIEAFYVISRTTFAVKIYPMQKFRENLIAHTSIHSTRSWGGGSISYHLRISAPYFACDSSAFSHIEREISDAIKPMAREQLMVIPIESFIDYYVKWKVRLDKYVRSSIDTLKGLKLHCSCLIQFILKKSVYNTRTAISKKNIWNV